MKHVLLALLLSTAIASPARAQEQLNLYGGATDVFKDAEDGASNNMWGLAGIEYRGAYLWKNLRPNFGAQVNSEGSQYYYGGLGYDFYLNSSRSILFTPNAAVGLYHHADGDGKDLGGMIEFKTGLELAYQWPDRTRLGLAIHHISNASIYDENPGTEQVTVQYSTPIRLFK